MQQMDHHVDKTDTKEGGLIEESGLHTVGRRPIWWRSVLATQVDGDLPSGAPLQIAELWPSPAEGTQLLVSIVQVKSRVKVVLKIWDRVMVMVKARPNRRSRGTRGKQQLVSTVFQ